MIASYKVKINTPHIFFVGVPKLLADQRIVPKKPISFWGIVKEAERPREGSQW